MSNQTDARDPFGIMDPLLYKVSERPLTPGFMILASIMVLLMQLGFAQLEVGIAPMQSTQNIFMKNMLDTACNALAWFIFGFGLAYGEGEWSNGFIGSGAIGQSNVNNSYAWFVTFTYVNNAATIAGGPLAGRTKLSAFMLLSVFMSVFVFPVLSHWIWARLGWMTLLEFQPLDFVGAGPVHLLGGVVGLCGSYIIGPRASMERGCDADRKYDQAHNKILAASGAYLLWISWLAFTTVAVGTVTVENQIDVVGRVATGTMLGGAAGALTSYVSRRLLGMHYDIIHLGNSMLVGLTSITASCGVIQPWAAIVIGSIGAILFMGLCKLIARLHIDDPLDAAAVHISGGLWALIATGFFADGDLVQLVDAANPSTAAGLFYGGDAKQMGAQLLEAACTIAWGVLTATVFFTAMHRFGKLRVSKEAELGGLDLFKHGARPGQHDEHENEPSDLPTFSRGKDTRRLDTSNPFNTKPTSQPTTDNNRAGLTYLRSLFKQPSSVIEATPTAKPLAANSPSEWRGRSRLGSIGAPDNVELTMMRSHHALHPGVAYSDADMYGAGPTGRIYPRERRSRHPHGASPFAAHRSHGQNFAVWESDSGSVDDSHTSVEGHGDDEAAVMDDGREAFAGAHVPSTAAGGFAYPPPNAPNYPASLPPWQDLYALQNIQMWQQFLDSRYPVQATPHMNSTSVAAAAAEHAPEPQNASQLPESAASSQV